MWLAGTFSSGQAEIAIENVQHDGWNLISPFLELVLRPTAVKANGARQVLGEAETVFAFPHESVAELAASVDIVNSPCGVSIGVDKTQENLTIAAVLRMVVPGLRGVEFGTGAMTTRSRNRRGRFFVRRIVKQDSLAGITLHYLPGADFVEGLRTQHDLAAHTFLIAGLSNAGATVFGNAIVML